MTRRFQSVNIILRNYICKYEFLELHKKYENIYKLRLRINFFIYAWKLLLYINKRLRGLLIILDY
jgi:hypothetical protein